MDAAALQKLAGAVENGKKRSLNTFLGCYDGSPTGKTLHSSPAHAKALLEIYHARLNSDYGSALHFHALSRLQIFQALLMIYPSYETPWSAIGAFTSSFAELPVDEAFHCVSAVEFFLDDAVNGTSDFNFAVLCGHVGNFVGRLWNQTRKCSGEQLVLLTDLLLGILIFSNLNLSEQSNDQTITAVDLCGETFPIWLGLFQKLCSVPCHEILVLARDRAIAYVARHGQESSLVSCFSVVDASFSIAKSNTAWFTLSIQLLIAINARKGDYIRLERHIEKCLRRSSVNEFNDFRRYFDSEIINTEWVRLSFLLVMCRCAKESTARIVSDLFSSALTVSAFSVDEDAHLSHGDQVLDFLFPDEEIKAQLELNGGEDDKFLLVEVLNDLTYAGEGLVVDPDGSKVNALSRASKLILAVLRCGPRNDERSVLKETDVALERSMNLLFLADSFLDCSEDFRELKAMLFFSLCVTIMYSTNSLDRGEIADKLFRGIRSINDSRVRKNACIVTLGLIIRSSSSLDFVEDVATFLEPCTMLLDGRCIDTATYMHLATFMAGSEAARLAVLKCSKAIILRNYSSAWRDGGADLEFHVDDMRAGLFGLLELLRSSSWGDLEIQAWGVFSDCLVLNKPQINVADRKWLYEQITESFLDDDKGSSTSVNHFLRATIARLGIFMVRETQESSLRFVPENSFIVWVDPSTTVIQTRQVDDIFRLLRLSFFLLFHGSTLRGRTSQSKFELKSWDALSSSVQRHTRPKDSDRRFSSMSAVLSAWLDVSGVDTRDVAFATLLAYLAGIYDHLVLLHEESQDVDVGLRGDYAALLQRCFSLIIEQEQSELVRAETEHSSLISFPYWPRGGSYDLFGSREIDVDPEWITPLHLSLCDLLIEGIGGHYFRRIPVDARSLHVCKNIVLAVGSVLEVKQILLDKEKSTSTNANFGLDSQTVAHTSTQFFLAASQCIENSLRKELSLETAGMCLEAIQLFCVAFANASGGLTTGLWVPLVHGVWALYQTIASEKGAMRFIGYLESNLMAERKVPKTDASVCSLRSIRSSDDVDERTRNMRFCVLNALEKCLGFGARNDADLQDLALEEGLDNGALLVARVCRELSQDLRIGLDGNSGGITTEIYESYLKAMQTCATSIEVISRQQGIEVPSVSFHLLVEVVDILRDILQAYPMRDAVLFRSTLIMALAEFPSIIREGARRRSDNFSCRNMSEMHDELFEDCLSILKRWSATRDPNAIPWEDIAGEKHIGAPERMDSGDGVELKRRKEPKSVEVRFQGKEIWSWALSCSFVAMEKEWHEAFQAIIFAPDRSHRTTKDSFGEGTHAFLVQQRESLRSTIVRAGKLFRSSTVEVYAEGQGAALDVLAMNLPSAPRLRFCHMLAAISKVLKYAIDHVCSCLGTGIGSKELKQDSKLSFVEALSTFEPWLRVDDTEIDFVVGTFRWLSILRRKLPPGTPRPRYVDTTELFPWVSRVSALMRDLPSSLRQVIALLGHDECLRGLEDALLAVLPGGRDALFKILTRKLSVLETALPAEHSQASLPNFPTIGPEGIVTRNKRSTRHKSQLRPKKRAVIQIPKSRNSIVNEFMSLDRKSSENDGAPTDAFVDLEDFLVEG